ncbi:MAG: hypothetical protein HRT47_11535 [Candidatus Caenarcaniphilales bacterium]|nr:hypothetical protein [Candidatus Caenarcaniphilales bacterium]
MGILNNISSRIKNTFNRIDNTLELTDKDKSEIQQNVKHAASSTWKEAMLEKKNYKSPLSQMLNTALGFKSNKDISQKLEMKMFSVASKLDHSSSSNSEKLKKISYLYDVLPSINKNTALEKVINVYEGFISDLEIETSLGADENPNQIDSQKTFNKLFSSTSDDRNNNLVNVASAIFDDPEISKENKQSMADFLFKSYLPLIDKRIELNAASKFKNRDTAQLNLDVQALNDLLDLKINNSNKFIKNYDINPKILDSLQRNFEKRITFHEPIGIGTPNDSYADVHNLQKKIKRLKNGNNSLNNLNPLVIANKAKHSILKPKKQQITPSNKRSQTNKSKVQKNTSEKKIPIWMDGRAWTALGVAANVGVFGPTLISNLPTGNTAFNPNLDPDCDVEILTANNYKDAMTHSVNVDSYECIVEDFFKDDKESARVLLNASKAPNIATSTAANNIINNILSYNMFYGYSIDQTPGAPVNSTNILVSEIPGYAQLHATVFKNRDLPDGETMFSYLNKTLANFDEHEPSPRFVEAMKLKENVAAVNKNQELLQTALNDYPTTIVNGETVRRNNNIQNYYEAVNLQTSQEASLESLKKANNFLDQLEINMNRVSSSDSKINKQS